MSCLGARLDDLIDGRLSPELADQALSHVVGCERCLAELTAQRRLRAMLATSSAPSADADLVSRLTEVAEGVSAVELLQTGAPRVRRPARRVATVSSALVAVGLAGMGIAWASGPGSAASPSAPPVGAVVIPAVDQFSAEHAACADALPLAAPGSTAAQVGYAVQSGEPAAHRPR